MSSAFFTATRIHDGYRFLPQGSILEVAKDGVVIDIHQTAPASAEITSYTGVLCPGFINTHCHLELSHMRGVITEHTGLIPFLQGVMRQRGGFTDEQKSKARHDAYHDLLRHGVVAVGDIANSTDTLDVRALGQLHMHTFVESLGFTETAAAARLAYSVGVLEAFEAQESERVVLRQSIVPHAPYSVSPALFRLISEASSGRLISIHNQEALAEDEYYRDKTGAVRDLLTGLGIDDAFFAPSGKSSLQTYLPLLEESHPLIFVHNTRTSEADIRFAQVRALQPFWCLCPGANMYIEGTLPDVPMIAEATDNICIGTDSLASNHQLSVLAELELLNSHFPHLGWETLLRWGTMNGAQALQMNDAIGSFTRGKKPGVLLIDSLEKNASVQRIM